MKILAKVKKSLKKQVYILLAWPINRRPSWEKKRYTEGSPATLSKRENTDARWPEDTLSAATEYHTHREQFSFDK